QSHVLIREVRGEIGVRRLQWLSRVSRITMKLGRRLHLGICVCWMLACSVPALADSQCVLVWGALASRVNSGSEPEGYRLRFEGIAEETFHRLRDEHVLQMEKDIPLYIEMLLSHHPELSRQDIIQKARSLAHDRENLIIQEAD